MHCETLSLLLSTTGTRIELSFGDMNSVQDAWTGQNGLDTIHFLFKQSKRLSGSNWFFLKDEELHRPGAVIHMCNPS
jgi:hypothetical protein